jgi:glycosyltransferase involved in cell wall biosynthesis
MAAGLPVIYSPVGALAEIMGPENGIRLELSELSGETVGCEIWSLMQDQRRRETMRAANQRLSQKYDVSVVFAQMIDVYRHVAESAH